MGEDAPGHRGLSRRSALQGLGSAGAAAGLAGCLDLGILGEDERDVSLQPAPWITPSMDQAVASGYADFSSIYSAVGEMDDVTWPAFTEWYGQPAPQPEDRSSYPLVPRDVIAGGSPFVVEQDGESWHHSRGIPAMASMTIQTGDDEESLRHLTVYELPDSDTKSEVKEYMSNHGRKFKQVDSVSVTKTLNTYNESEQFVSSTYALEDGVLVNQIGSLLEEPGEKNYGHLTGAVERAGSSVDLGDHPVSGLSEMDILHTYQFEEDAWVDAVSKSVAIDFETERKVGLYTFEDEATATEARDQFEVTDDGDLRADGGDQELFWNATTVDYTEVRTAGRGVRIEGHITELARAITEGYYIWNARFASA